MTIQDVAERCGIKLVRAGKKLRGFSPFLEEKTPSFFIDEKRGIWHDFASGQHGDGADFVREMDRYADGTNKLLRRNAEALMRQVQLVLMARSIPVEKIYLD